MADYKIEAFNKACQIWKDSKGKIPIRRLAREVGVTAGTIARWRDNGWVQKSKRLGGAPKGSQNAKGHGAPKGSQNGLKTGAYSKIDISTLTPEETHMLLNYDKNPIKLLDFEIGLMLVRQKRMFELLEAVRADRDMITEEISHIAIETVFSPDNPSLKEQTKRRQALVDKIIAIEEALTKVQEKVVRAIESRNKLTEKQAEKKKETTKDSPINFVFNRKV